MRYRVGLCCSCVRCCRARSVATHWAEALFNLIVPSLPLLLRWKLCRCSVQIQCQHILQWSPARSNARRECVQVSACDLSAFTLLVSSSLSLPFFSLCRVFSPRTKRSSSTMPSWHFYPRRLSCQPWTLSWRATSRPFDGWWPRRLASRLLLSCLSKNAAVRLPHSLLLLL